jgi:hypothetical protein
VRPAVAYARRHEAQPWSVPRLRGRGEQGNIVMHTQVLSALYVRTCASSHPRAQHNGESGLSLTLLTTASQARHAPRLAPPRGWIRQPPDRYRASSHALVCWHAMGAPSFSSQRRQRLRCDRRQIRGQPPGITADHFDQVRLGGFVREPNHVGSGQSTEFAKSSLRDRGGVFIL